MLVLTSKYVFYHFPDNRQKRKGFVFTFDTIFQIMRTKPVGEAKSLGKPYGVKFISDGAISQEFYTDNTRDLEKW